MGVAERKLKEKKDRHDAILAAAEHIMNEHGLHGLNMDMVAHETELAKGTLYLYFKSKDEILGALSLKARTLLLHEFEKAIKKVARPIDQLKAIVTANYTFYKKSPLYYELVSLYEINNQLTESDELKLASMKITKLVVDIVEKAKADGSLNPSIDAGLLSISIWGMTVGMIQLIKVRGPLIKKYQGISEKAILDHFIDVLEHGYKAH